MDYIPVVTYLVMNFIVILSSFILAYKLFRFPGFLDSLLSWAIIYFVQIVLSELLLGVFGMLTLQNVVSLNLLILLVVWVTTRKKLLVLNFNDFKRNIFELLKNRFISLTVCVILGFGLVKIWINLINAPFGWDSLNYHFTFAVEWLKHRNLDTPLVVFCNPSPTYYPLNGSLFYLWSIFPFRNVFLADIGQLPFFILVFFAIYNICRKLNVSKENSFFAAALMTITPNYFRQLSIGYVDVMVCAWFLLSLNFLVNLTKNLDLKNVAFFSLALGMLIGTKTIALVYSFILLIFFIYLIFRKGSGLSIVKFFVTFLALTILIGGFSYIRNYVQAGNPLYPLTFKILNKVVFKGVMDKNNFTVFSLSDEYSLSRILFHEGMGAGCVLFIIPGVFLVLYRCFRRRSISLNEAILFSSFIFMYLAYRFAVSLPNVRYLYPMVGVGFIMAFYSLNNINLSRKILKWLVLVCLLASLPEMARKLELVASLGLSFALFIIILFLRDYLKKLILKLVLIFIFITPFALVLGNRHYNSYEFPSYIKTAKYTGFWPDAVKAWDWLNKNTSGNNVAYVGRPVPFPLYGTNFKNNVYYVSLNKTEPIRLHLFPDSFYRWDSDFLSMHKSFQAKGNYRSGADYSVWLNNLLGRNTDFLVIYSLHQTKEIYFPVEDEWAKANPGRFSPVFTNETIHIYKILK